MLFQVDLIPRASKILLSGHPVTIRMFAGAIEQETGYETTPQNILNSIQNGKMLWKSPKFKESANILREVCESKNISEIVFTGDMIITDEGTAAVKALDAFDLLASVCGIPTNYQFMPGCRVQITGGPIPALELQQELKNGCWDTTRIISTDPKDIEMYKAYAAAREEIKNACLPAQAQENTGSAKR